MRLLKRLAVLTAAATLFVAACSEGPTTPHAGDPSFDISDAVHNDGSEHFFWLPPMVGNPATDGVFDGALAPTVEICEFDEGSEPPGCVARPFAIFTTMTGSGSETVRVNELDEFYIVNWHTDESDLNATATYRISVLVEGTELGFADVDVVNSGKDLKYVIRGQYIPLKDGRTLPIKFRIEDVSEPPGP